MLKPAFKFRWLWDVPTRTFIEAIRRGSVSKEAGAQGILDWIEHELTLIIEQHAASLGRPAAIGMGFGGPVDSATGTVLTSHQIAGWQGIKLKRWFDERFGLPLRVRGQ